MPIAPYVACSPGQQRQRQQRRSQPRREQVVRAGGVAEQRAGVRIGRAARQHADEADAREEPRGHAGQAHQRVDQRVRNHRGQAQREEVERTVSRQPGFDGEQAVAPAAAHRVAPPAARQQERRGGAYGRRDGNHQRADNPPETHAGQQCQHAAAGQCRCRQHRKGDEEAGAEQHRLGRVPGQHLVPPCVQPLRVEQRQGVGRRQAGPQQHQAHQADQRKHGSRQPTGVNRGAQGGHSG